MKLTLPYILFLCISINLALGQSGSNFLKINETLPFPVVAMDLSPSKEHVAMSTLRGPVYIYNANSLQEISQFKISGYELGPKINYSRSGKYILLQEQYYNDAYTNKDRKGDIDILDAQNGNSIFHANGALSADIDETGEKVYVLKSNTIVVYQLKTGEELKRISLEDPGTSIAVSGDGSLLAVSHKLELGDVKNIPSIRNDKKAIKQAVKFREIVYFYNTQSFSLSHTSDDFFDMIFSMTFNNEGNQLYVYSTPNNRLLKKNTSGVGATNGLRQGYISIANAADGAVSRVMFNTRSANPELQEHPTEDAIAVSSQEMKNFSAPPEVLIYIKSTAEIFKKFEIKKRWREGPSGDRAAFVFLPAKDALLIGYGQELIQWNYLK